MFHLSCAVIFQRTRAYENTLVTLCVKHEYLCCLLCNNQQNFGNHILTNTCSQFIDPLRLRAKSRSCCVLPVFFILNFHRWAVITGSAFSEFSCAYFIQSIWGNVSLDCWPVTCCKKFRCSEGIFKCVSEQLFLYGVRWDGSWFNKFAINDINLLPLMVWNMRVFYRQWLIKIDYTLYLLDGDVRQYFFIILTKL